MTTLREATTATILDVARLAGVSRTTVSRVLNEPDRVSPETLERVRAAAEQLRYFPNSAARSLRSGRTGTIALLVGDISQPFHAELAKAVSHEAEARGMTVMLSDLDRSDDRLVALMSRLPKQGTDGVLIATGDAFGSDRPARAIQEVINAGVPVVVTVPEPRVRGAIALGADYPRVARAATAQLLADGSRRVELVVGTADAFHSRFLANGYRQALADAGLTPAAPLVGEYDYETTRRIVGERLRRAEPLDGLVVATVPMAVAAIRAIEESGRRVPDDVAVVACEQVHLAAAVRPTVSTVAVHPETNGAEMVRLLHDAIRGREPQRQELLPVLTRRESSRPR